MTYKKQMGNPASVKLEYQTYQAEKATVGGHESRHCVTQQGRLFIQGKNDLHEADSQSQAPFSLSKHIRQKTGQRKQGGGV